MSTAKTIKYRPAAIRNIIREVIILLLLILFLGTAASKWLDQETFREGLGKSPFLSSYASILAPAVPLAEALTGALLLFRHTLLWGLYSTVFLMSAFTAYIYLLLHYSYYVPCLCHAALESLTWQQHLVFNLVFLALAVTGVLLETRRKSTGGHHTNPSHYHLQHIKS